MSNPTTPFSWQMPTSTDLVTDLPADFEVFGQAVATSMADLLGGTTGQILSKTTSTDMDFTWINNDQGDITNVAVTSPITGGGSSGSVTIGINDATTSVKGSVQLSDSTSTTSSVLAATPTAVKSAYDLADGAIAKTTVTTAGDIIYRNATVPTRLGIGTAGQVLTVNSGATAPQWSTTSPGGLTLLSTTTFNNSVSNYTVSGISGSYKNLLIVGSNLQTNGGSAMAITFQFNGDTGNNYNSSGIRNLAGTVASYGDILGDNYQTGIVLAVTSDSSPRFGNFQLMIYNYASTSLYKAINAQGGCQASGSLYTNTNSGNWQNSTTAITSVKFAEALGSNLKVGTIQIYGVN